MSERGLVSVIVPVHNRAAFLRVAAASVLDQDYPAVELLIVDDGSTDDTPAVAREIAAGAPGRVRLLMQANAGPGAAREAGRLQARGEFLQYLDSDDVLLPGKFSKQVAGLREHPECGASYGWARLRKPDGTASDRPMRRTGEEMQRIFPAMLAERWWHTGAMLYRGEVADAAGPWTALRLHEDWEYDCRLGAMGILLNYVPAWVCEIRDHEQPKLSRGARFDPARLADRAEAFRLMAGHARAAGLDRGLPEVRHFSRALFLLARDCGAAGLAGKAQELFLRSRELSLRPGGLDYRAFGLLARVLGWRAAGKIAAGVEAFRKTPAGPRAVENAQIEERE